MNNNGTWENEDTFGIVNLYYYAWLESFGIEFFHAEEDGTVTSEVDLDKTMSIVETVHNLFFNTNGGLPCDTGHSVAANTAFSQGNALFNYCSIRFAVSNFSFSDVTYGILPFPKLDEQQENYYNGMTNKPCAIPVTVPEENLEKVALITEALNIEGYHTVFPAYFETALKARYADNNDDAQMLDIIHDNSFFAFSYLYGGGSIYQTMLSDLLGTVRPSLDVASYIARNQSTMDERAAKLTEFFTN